MLELQPTAYAFKGRDVDHDLEWFVELEGFEDAYLAGVKKGSTPRGILETIVADHAGFNVFIAPFPVLGVDYSINYLEGIKSAVNLANEGAQL